VDGVACNHIDFGVSTQSACLAPLEVTAWVSLQMCVFMVVYKPKARGTQEMVADLTRRRHSRRRRASKGSLNDPVTVGLPHLTAAGSNSSMR